ncbi:MAG: zinc ribbon domain-containing protein [Lachnospiraceae bacterium]|nr:zinc ribbon domain-containing protein [Lachnospiraceae bacterium]
MANFCRNCGTRLTPNVKFCPNCGQPIAPGTTVSGQAASGSGPAGPALTPGRGNGQTFGNTPGTLRAPQAKSPAGICILLSAVMVLELVLIAFWQPGLLRSDRKEPAASVASAQNNSSQAGNTGSQNTGQAVPGSQGGSFRHEETSLAGTTGHNWEPEDPAEGGDSGNYRVVSSWTSEQVASGMLTEDNLSIRSNDGASMTINECYLDGDTAAEIRRVPGTVDYRAGDITVPLTLYEFNAEGITDDTYMTLEIPMAKPADGTVGAGCYDPATGTIWPVPFDYDEARGVIQIHATHLSTYCGFPVDNAGTRNAMLGYLSYYDLWQMTQNSENYNLQKHAGLLETSAFAGNSWSVADEIVNDLGIINVPAGAIVGGLDVVGSLESALKASDGAGGTIIKNSYGTIGEIMNTMWGRSGSWGVSKRYGGPVTVVEIEDKLKSTYPSSKIENIGKGLNILNTGLSAYKILQHAKNGDTKAAAWESVQLGFDRVMAFVGEKMAFPAMSVYLVGVSLFAYALNEFYTEALNGRKEVYMKAYTKYYNSRGTDGGYRSATVWRKEFTRIMKAGGGIQGVEAEIDDYVNEFWRRADEHGMEYLVSVMTEEEKAAWGVAGQGGLNPDIKKEITTNYKASLMPNLMNILRVMNDKNMDELMETYMAQYEELCRSMNQYMTIKLIDGTKEADKPSMYAGLTVRFKGLKGKVADPKKWEVVLDKNGQGEIRCTFLAHLMVNAGDVLEVVKIEGDKEQVIHEQKFKIKLPLSRVILEMPEMGVWELQGVRYESHWKWTGKNGGTIGERWTELKINENATAYSYITTEGGESKDGSGKLPGAVVTAEQLAETFTDKIVLDNAVIAYLIEGVPEGYDFGKTDIRDLDNYKKETRYLFQEAGAGRQSLFRSAAANADAKGSRVLMINMPGVTLIYRERPSDTASDSTWHIYPVEKIDKWN